ncbi:hypothetical protein [Streptomyces sp. WMMC940]|uniref:hypothetical protein n=1 Tax=Streptomyces sp. WMMC940 TaxID=3015153 RepID=UPI0022B6466D|nr:hypothetical protein [Streptomyces sp. WMMC940]MCZ7462352.1 hypothetical protein [Streptomyces sp. WMMC940]
MEGQAGASAADPYLRPGDYGSDVVHLQRLVFGQSKTNVSPTGVSDVRTTPAVTEVQQERSLSGDPLGVYGPSPAEL